MPIASIRDLPLDVREEISDEKYMAVDDELYCQFQLNGAQIAVYGQAFVDILLGQRKTTELLELLSRMPDANRVDVRGLALAMALRRLWPVSYYLKDLEILIRRLGGRVPEEKPQPRAAAAEEVAEVLFGTARDILQAYHAYTEYYLTKKPMRMTDGRLKAPTATNWLQDYLHVMGAEGANSLKRSQYIAKIGAAQRLNDAEKQNLLNFLASYEDGVPMYWSVVEGQYLVIEFQRESRGSEADVAAKSTHTVADLSDRYRAVQEEYARLLDEKKSALSLEVNDNVRKFADILWESLGLEETDRALTAIALLIDRHVWIDTLRSDQRFKGIVARYIDVKYGVEAKTFWKGDITGGVGLTLLWRIMLVDKLLMDEDRAAIIADYFTKQLGEKTSPMYLDLASGKFLFRDIAYKDRVLSIV